MAPSESEGAERSEDEIVISEKRSDDVEDDYVSSIVVKDLEWPGHTVMFLKADNERALQAFVCRVIRIATARCHNPEQVAKEHPARYDSQSDGLIEVGLMLVR